MQNILFGPIPKGKINTLAATEIISGLSRLFGAHPQSMSPDGMTSGDGIGLYGYHLAQTALRSVSHHHDPSQKVMEECIKYASMIKDSSFEAKKTLKEIRTIQAACKTFNSVMSAAQSISCETRALALFNGLEIDGSNVAEVQIKGNSSASNDIHALIDRMEGVFLLQPSGGKGFPAIFIRFGTQQILLDQQGLHTMANPGNRSLAESIMEKATSENTERFHFFKLKEAPKEDIGEIKGAIPLIKAQVDAKRPFDSERFHKTSPGKHGIAVISGAGISGLAAAIELRSRGYKVVVVEKRSDFSRFNVINISKEAQEFLRRHDLLKEFETSLAGRIEEHQNVLIKDNRIETIFNEDVSTLTFDGSIPADPLSFDKLFQESGIYSVPIKGLQAFLAEKAIKAGVKILSDAEISVDRMTSECKVEVLSIKRHDAASPIITVKPDLLFLAEGAHSKTAEKLGLVDEEMDLVENACTGENWIFGNFKYEGNRSFVISIIEASQETLQIANVIFNGKSRVVNIAATVDKGMDSVQMKERIITVAKYAFSHANIKEEPVLLEVAKQPVNIINRKASLCSKGNVFRIGDDAGSSSPLAGLGGTLNLTLVPLAISKLCFDYAGDRKAMHKNFKEYTQAYVGKWIDKSLSVKNIIMGIYSGARLKSKEASHEN